MEHITKLDNALPRRKVVKFNCYYNSVSIIIS
nr:MAG TPA: hypothetical protein [Crassvirales sp.]